MPLNKLQQSAVEYLDGPLLVLAGPGTGKTQLLSSKVAYILKETDATPDNILCITFTDAAAENMRSRLFSIIGQAAGKVNIHTYHSFGASLLNEFKNHTNLPIRRYDQAISNVNRYKIVKQLFENLPFTDILRRQNTKISDIIETLSSAKSARLTGHDLTLIAEHNLQTTKKINKEIEQIFQNLKPRLPFQTSLDLVYTPLLNLFAANSDPRPITKNFESEINFYLRELNQIITSESEKPKPKTSVLTSWRNKRFEKTDQNTFRLKNVVANKKLKSIATILTNYEKILADEGLYDFNDMIEEAITALKSDASFRFTLSERFQYILLDEFQDTNPSQFEIIHLLTDYERPNLMAVGDDDQAIYAFQGASASNFLDFNAAYHPKIITLTDNYRSTSEILALSHQIADQIADSFAHQHKIDKVLKSIRNEELAKNLPSSFHSKSRISRHEFMTVESEFSWLASEVQKLIKQGVRQSDICIIAPKHKYITPLLPFLKAHPEIHLAYERRENVFEDQKIHELLVLAEFIHLLSQNRPAAHLLLEIFSFPFWQIPPLELLPSFYQASLNGHTLELLTNSNHQKIKEVAAFLAELSLLSHSISLELFLQILIGFEPITLHLPNNETTAYKSPFLSYYTADQYSTFTLYENLSVLKEHLKKHLANEHNSLSDLITFLDDYREAGEAITSTSPYQDAKDAVQILSAHKSKGLEFDHVFLISVDDLCWGNAKGNNNQLTLPANLTSIRHTGNTEEERLRLFFVAITRAAKTLTMTNSLKDFSGKSPNRLSFLAEYQSEDKVISPFLPSQTVITHYEEYDDAEKACQIEKHWFSAYQTFTPSLQLSLQKRLENYRITATHLTSFIDPIYAGPLTFYTNVLLKAPTPPADLSLHLGNLVHQTFEAVVKEHLDLESALAFYQKNLSLLQLPAIDNDNLLKTGASIIKASIDNFSAIFSASKAFAEYDFYPEKLMFGAIPITGKIDLITVDENAKTIEIYDYKTSTYRDSNWSAHPSLYKYALQLEFYRLLISQSPNFKGYTVNKAHILFVNPDPITGKVYDKVYEYSSESKQNFDALLSAVYRHITSLDFISHESPLAIHPDKKHTLKDLLAFIDLIIKTP